MNIRQVKVDLDEFIKETHYLQGIKALRKIEKANEDLEERNLAKVYRVVEEGKYGIRVVQLTIEGKDLGRKYSNKLDTVGLWISAIEHRWLWAIIIFFVGCLVKWLFDLLLMIIQNNK